jgi:hypothetical protein
MITIITSDGQRFEGQGYEDLVIGMKLDMWIPPSTKERYMAEVADRVETFQGQKIKYHDSKTFLLELKRIGVISKISDSSLKVLKGGKK